MDIAKYMNVPIGKYVNASEIFEEIARVTPIMRGISHERLDQQGIQWPCPDYNHPGTPTLFLDEFPTENGKAKIIAVDHIEPDEQASEEYPIILNSGRILNQYHSATMSRKNDVLNAYGNESYIILHPEDANKQGFTENEKVKVFNQRGSLETKLYISEQVNKGEAFMPWHFGESLVNNLTRDSFDPFSKIAPFKLSAIRIESMNIGKDNKDKISGNGQNI